MPAVLVTESAAVQNSPFLRRCGRNHRLYSCTNPRFWSRMNFSGYVGHVTVFSWMLTTACCLVVVKIGHFNLEPEHAKVGLFWGQCDFLGGIVTMTTESSTNTCAKPLTNQPDTNPNPNCNPNLTAKQQAMVNIQLNIVTCPTFPEKFIWDNIVAPFVPTSVFIGTLPILGDIVYIWKLGNWSFLSVDTVHVSCSILTYCCVIVHRYVIDSRRFVFRND